MALHGIFSKAAKSPGQPAKTRRARPLAAAAVAATAATAAMALSLAATGAASASTTPTLTYGTLDTQPGNAAAEHKAGVTNAMFEFNWASFEPTQGVLSASYLATMKSELAAYAAAGQKVTLGLGLENPPSWVFKLANSHLHRPDRRRLPGREPGLQRRRPVRRRDLPVPGRRQDPAVQLLGDPARRRHRRRRDALPRRRHLLGLRPRRPDRLRPGPGMTPNPDPNWRPGQPGLTQAQIAAWVSWYIGGLDNLTNWEMQTLSGLGFTGYYETLTPGSGTRPDGLAQTEQQNLSNDGTTGVGAVWNMYYAQLPNKTRVMAYVSSVADQSGGNDSCQSGDNSLSLTNPAMDSWSATRWITRIAHQYGRYVGGENPGLNMPASLDTFYTDTSSNGMMSVALQQARSCGFKVFYWAHDIHLWDGTIPFSLYASKIAG